MNKLAFISYIGLVSAVGNIVVDVFAATGCGGNALGNVQADASQQFDSSGCKGGAPFNSVKVASGDANFQCNLYSDTECKNFSTTVTAVAPGLGAGLGAGIGSVIGLLPSKPGNQCSNVMGSGIICFNQATFNNPFADSIATVSLAKALLTVDDVGSNLVKAGISASCSATACLSNKPNIFSKPFNHFNKNCQLTVTTTGSFVDANQRDYMGGLLGAAFDATVQNARIDGAGSSIGNNNVLDIMNEASVVIRGKDNDIQATMDVSFDVTCASTKSADCSSFQERVTETILKAVPDVGGLAAAVFKAGC